MRQKHEEDFMEKCDEPECDEPVFGMLNGRKVCVEHYDLLRDLKEEIAFE